MEGGRVRELNLKKFVTAQEPEFRSQEPGVRMRTQAATFEDVGYGDVSELMQLLEEFSTLLEAYSRSILDSGSWLLTT